MEDGVASPDQPGGRVRRPLALSYSLTGSPDLALFTLGFLYILFGNFILDFPTTVLMYLAVILIVKKEAFVMNWPRKNTTALVSLQSV